MRFSFVLLLLALATIATADVLKDNLPISASQIGGTNFNNTQSFTVETSTYNVTNITVYFGVQGAPTGGIKLGIYNESSDLPSAFLQNSTNTLDTSTVVAGWYNFSFLGNLTLVNGTKYVIVIWNSTADGANRLLTYGAANTTYAGGRAAQGGTLINIQYDYGFFVYAGTSAPAINYTIAASAATYPTAVVYNPQILQGNCTGTGNGLTSMQWAWLNGTYNGGLLTQTVYSSGANTTPIAVNISHNLANVTNMTLGTYWQFRCTAIYGTANATALSALVNVASYAGVMTITSLLTAFFAAYFTVVACFFIVGICYILIKQISGTLIASGILFMVVSFISGDATLPLLGIGAFVLGLAMKFILPNV